MDGREERAGSDALADRRFSRRDVDDRRSDALARMPRRRLRLVVSGRQQKQPPSMVRYADLRQSGQGAPLPPAPVFLNRFLLKDVLSPAFMRLRSGRLKAGLKTRFHFWDRCFPQTNIFLG